MDVRDLVRTPIDWVKVALIVGAALLVWLALSKLDDLTAWWPWSDESRLARTQRELDHERSRSGALTEQTEAREVIQREAERSHTVIVETRTVAVEASAATHGAPDAESPLSPDLFGVIGDADRRMCMAEPASCAGRSTDR